MKFSTLLLDILTDITNPIYSKYAFSGRVYLWPIVQDCGYQIQGSYSDRYYAISNEHIIGNGTQLEFNLGYESGESGSKLFFINCTFENVWFHQCDLNGIGFDHCEFKNCEIEDSQIQLAGNIFFLNNDRLDNYISTDHLVISDSKIFGDFLSTDQGDIKFFNSTINVRGFYFNPNDTLQMTNCSVYGADFGSPTNAAFTDCQLQNVVFQSLSDSRINNCTLNDVNFINVNNTIFNGFMQRGEIGVIENSDLRLFTAESIKINNIRNCDFRGSSLSDVSYLSIEDSDFSNSHLENFRLGETTNSNTNYLIENSNFSESTWQNSLESESESRWLTIKNVDFSNAKLVHFLNPYLTSIFLFDAQFSNVYFEADVNIINKRNFVFSGVVNNSHLQVTGSDEIQFVDTSVYSSELQLWTGINWSHSQLRDSIIKAMENQHFINCDFENIYFQDNNGWVVMENVKIKNARSVYQYNGNDHFGFDYAQMENITVINCTLDFTNSQITNSNIQTSSKLKLTNTSLLEVELMDDIELSLRDTTITTRSTSQLNELTLLNPLNSDLTRLQILPGTHVKFLNRIVGVNCTGMQLQNTTFDSSTSYESIYIKNSSFHNANLTGLRTFGAFYFDQLKRCKMLIDADVDLNGTDLSNAELSYACLNRSDIFFDSCNLTRKVLAEFGAITNDRTHLTSEDRTCQWFINSSALPTLSSSGRSMPSTFNTPVPTPFQTRFFQPTPTQPSLEYSEAPVGLIVIGNIATLFLIALVYTVYNIIRRERQHLNSNPAFLTSATPDRIPLTTYTTLAPGHSV